MVDLNKQINYVKAKIREYKEDIEYSQYKGKIEYATRYLPIYEGILKSLEKVKENYGKII